MGAIPADPADHSAVSRTKAITVPDNLWPTVPIKEPFRHRAAPRLQETFVTNLDSSDPVPTVGKASRDGYQHGRVVALVPLAKPGAMGRADRIESRLAVRRV